MRARFGEGRAAVWMLLASCVLFFFGAVNAGTTQAWFLDSGQWVEGSYRLGFINYDVAINHTNIGILREGQEVEVAVPIIGGVKIDDSASDRAKPEPYAEANFDEGATLLSVHFINTGDFPVYLEVEPDFRGLTAQGILAIPLPDGAMVDGDARTIRENASAAAIGYKKYVTGALAGAGLSWTAGDYESLAAAVDRYWVKKGSAIRSQEPIPADGTGEYTVNVLVFAEYDRWTAAASAAEGNGVQRVADTVRLTITASPTKE